MASSPTENPNTSRLGTIISDAIESGSVNALEKEAFIPPPPQPKLKILAWLKPVPWILLAAFILSFAWDFNNMTLALFGLELPLEGLIRIISVSGMIGFLTNWIAITMLFRPLKKRPLLGQGLIPAQKDRIAYRLSIAVSEDLINPELIRKKIEESDAVRQYRRKAAADLRKFFRQEEFRSEIKNWLIGYITDYLEDEGVRRQMSTAIADEINQKLMDKPIERTAVKTYEFLRGKELPELIEASLEDIPFAVQRRIDFVDELLDGIPRIVTEHGQQLDDAITLLLFNLVNRFDVQKLVEENLGGYEEERLEKMIQNATNEQLKTIQYLGAVLGTIGGFVIWQPLLSLAVLGTAAGSVWIADKWLYQ
jgi:uncharacterized membrane protein YheB (UPF0754 family)